MRCVFIIFTILVIPILAHAATLKVPSQYSTIQDAIKAASHGDTVKVAPGTYVENLNFKGKAITVTSSGGAGMTIIDGNQAGSVVKFKNGEGFNSVLNGFTLTNGTGTDYKSYSGFKPYCGGGIFCSGSSPTITKNTISGNFVFGCAGGIYCHYSSPTITKNTIIGNGATQGGGIYCDISSPAITNNTIANNSAKTGVGIYCFDNSHPAITNNTIAKNSTDHDGSGIYCYLHSSPSITNNTISGNSAKYGDGGGICCIMSCLPSITNNTISGNSAYGRSGGIFCVDNSHPAITNNTIIGNSANVGGGIHCDRSSPAITGNTIFGNSAVVGGGIYCYDNSHPAITNNSISGNSADNKGGGIYCLDKSSPPITNNTIFGNSAEDDGGGIYCWNSTSLNVINNTIAGNWAVDKGGGIDCNSETSMSIINTIFWDNSAPLGREIWIGNESDPSTLTISYSVVKGWKPSVKVEPGCTLNWGAGMIGKDPLFTAGPNGFYYLSQKAAGQPVNSPCANTGSTLAYNLGMNLYWTRTDGATDSGIVDMGFHYGDFTFPSLQTNTYSIQQSAGGDADFLLLAGSGNANRNYILLGSVSGNDPGTPLPGGMAVLPLNWDIFTNVVVDLLNTPVFSNFMGTLDGTGSASATFDTLARIPGAAGLTMHFAYALTNPWDFVSNPVAIEIVP